jgi:hypothetical protein
MRTEAVLGGSRLVRKGAWRNRFLFRRSLFWLMLLLAELEMFPEHCLSNTTISVEARPNSSEVFLDRGTITVNYTFPLISAGASTDASGQTSSQNTLRILVSAGGVELAAQPIENPTVTQGDGSSTSNSGTFSFYNPSSQFVRISGWGVYIREIPWRFPSVYAAFQEWTVLNGQTTIVGGDTPLGPSQASPPGQNPGSPSLVAPRSNIHAVIISGLSDPAKVITSPNVMVTGGIVALGKNASPPSTPSAWSPGLRIIPDYPLLTGEKIPPVTPNILDVRIVRQEVTADFSSPNPQPSN